MKVPSKVLEKFEKYTPIIDKEMKDLLESQEDLLMYQMMSYFLGFKNEKLDDLPNSYGGKRFRPGLTLLLSDFYGTADNAIEVATAIEIFHNFTLIHDDIEDNDPIRRGRPTVWRLWGITQAINTGDAQMMLANIKLIEGIKKHNLSLDIYEFLNKVYLKIAEGQFKDLHMADLPLDDTLVTEEYYLDMIAKKSAYLVGASAKVAGMIAGKDQSEVDALWDYGYNLGLAYQISDDVVSIWSDLENTGKEELADIREKKKTLPVICLFEKASAEERKKLEELYSNSKSLSDSEVSYVKQLLDAYKIKDIAVSRVIESVKKIEESIEKLSFGESEKTMLKKINEALFPVLFEENKC